MKYKKLLLFFMLFLFCLISASVFSEEPVLSEAITSAVISTEEGNITVDFKDADIHDVLRILSYKSGVNIVAGKDVEGSITIRLVGVPWEQALSVILKNSGFVYERDKGIIRVTTIDNQSKEEVSTEVFILNYSNAEQVSLAVQEMLTDRGKVKFDERTNQLIVTDVPSRIYKIGKVVERLDRKTAQVMIEAKLIETTLDKNENLGVDWTLQASASGATRPLMFPFAFDKTYGLTGTQYFPKVDTTDDAFVESVENGFPYAPYSPQTDGGDFSFGTLSFGQLQLALEILKTRTNTKIISNPKVTTLNNQEAKIGVTQTFNIPNYEVDSDTGRLVVNGYSETDIGVTLTVTPYVNPDGYIVVKLHPEVSAFVGWDSFTTGSGTIQAPRFSSRESTTQVMIKDKDTIVIGGLIKEQTTDTVKKIPILGDLPLLKYVFSKTEKTVDTTDLLIFVTVKLIDSEGQDIFQQQEAKVE